MFLHFFNSQEHVRDKSFNVTGVVDVDFVIIPVDVDFLLL
jgi:hypothetical protein